MHGLSATGHLSNGLHLHLSAPVLLENKLSAEQGVVRSCCRCQMFLSLWIASSCLSLTSSLQVTFALQGKAEDHIIIDLEKPPQMSRDERWVSLLALLSRVRCIRDLVIVRLTSRSAFNEHALLSSKRSHGARRHLGC